MDIPHLGFLILAWLGYFAVHSALASRAAKSYLGARLPRLTPHYRLTYNALSLALLMVPLWLLHGDQGEPLWRWSGLLRWVMDGLALAALVGFAWSLRYYDLGGSAKPAIPGRASSCLPSTVMSVTPGTASAS